MEDKLSRQFDQPHRNETLLSLEESRASGNYYVSLIRSLTGRASIDEAALSNIPSKYLSLFRSISQMARDFILLQEEDFAEQQMTAETLLRRVFHPDRISSVLEDEKNFQLIKLGRGLYTVMLSIDAWIKIGLTGQAVAASVPSPGVSFILLRDHKTSEFQDSYEEENIPHETHHLIWKNLLDNEIISCDEHTELRIKGFQMFQDEVIARLCSKGTLSGYSHLYIMSPEKKDKLTAEDRDNVEILEAEINDLNEVLRVIEGELRVVPTIQTSDLILGVMVSKNFAQLKEHLLQSLSTLEKQPHVQEEEIDDDEFPGWGTVQL